LKEAKIGCLFIGSESAYSALRGDGLYSRGSDLISSGYGSFDLPINLSLNSIACHVMGSDHQLLSILNALFRSLITFWDDSKSSPHWWDWSPSFVLCPTTRSM